MAFNRRRSMQVVAGASLALGHGVVGAAAAQDAIEDHPSFAHGVASGDPDATSVVLWTRVTTENETETVAWRIATDEGFADIVAEGEVPAEAARDHSVKVVARGLEPGATYFYRFTLGEAQSRTGRTKTLPQGEVARWGLALASCSNYAFGHFNAYDAIAKDEAIDLVVHTGDYIYEYGEDEWGDDAGAALDRRHEPPHEILSLEDYRTRHAQYKSDPGLKAMHAAHPFVAFWDDHETTNNPWKEGADNHDDSEGPWAPRRDASLQAYFEWMPLREATPRQDYWRSYQIGDLASLITLETRHSGRDRQPAYPDFASFAGDEDRERYVKEELGDPARRMLSDACLDHARQSLEASVAAGQPWRLIGSASPFARFLLPNFLEMGMTEDQFPPAAQYMIPNGRWNLPWYSDTWDGYTVARQEFYEMASSVGASDLMVLTGDTHNFFANELFDDGGARVGVEIGATGISSPGEPRDAGFPPELVEKIDAAFIEGMDEVRWTESVHNGYVRIVLEKNAADIAYVGVDTVLTPDYRTIELRQERVVKDGDTLVYS